MNTDVEEKRTTCNRDCPDACSILATVKGGRITGIKGDPEHPITQGSLCYRTQHFLERQYSPERLTTPLFRRNGSLVPITWSEALDIAAQRLTQIR
ncbi:MAG TPA: molybdopterin-containing oxidoreductase catalytic subunit, partial [Myxococcales bacterium]|nr:molybdopterin-containing oxidoreductase catalytic subunit [Myxococcales bacterium]